MDNTKYCKKISNSYADINPIYITGNGFFSQHGFSGGGTSTDPYILENCRITNKTEPKLIWIINTNAYFIIRNNYIDGIDKSPTGIYLYKVTNGVVEKNTFVNTWMGVWLGLDSNNNIITNNTFKNNEAGIRAINSFNNTYTNNNIFNNTLYGILMRGNSRDIISNNNIYDNDDNYGIYIADGISNLVMNNSVVNNAGGISIDDGEQNTIYNNSIIGNNMSGLVISNGFSGNFLFYASSNITSNTIMNNDFGLTISSWGNFQSAGGPNNVSKNIIIQNNDDGIYIDSSNYTITENVIYSNDGVGIRLGIDSNSVIVKGNDFIGNELSYKGFLYDSQAYNQGSNNNFSENYWDDWTCPDADADGIVDNSYPFCGYGCDASPLTSPHNDIPVDIHLLSRPRLIYPKGEELGAFEGYKGKITVKWCSVTDFSGHSVSYTLYYSDGREGSWEKVGTDLTTPEYEWDTTKVENSGGNFLKVVAECSEGETSEYSSYYGFEIENPRAAHGWSFAMLTLTLCLLVFASRRKKSK